MILRQRQKPIVLEKLEVLSNRLLPDNPELPKIEREVAQRQAGYKGELRLDYFLRYLPQTYSILNDVTLVLDNVKTQFDSIIISNQAIYLIEVKNITGTVTVDTTLRQFTRENGQGLEGFDDPITQVENATLFLNKWLRAHHLEGLPVFNFIAIASSKTIINVTGDEPPPRFTYVNAIPGRIIAMNEKLEKSNHQLKTSIIQKLQENTATFDFDIFKYFRIQPSDIQTGVQCPACGALTMIWKRENWRCSTCQRAASYAHHQALRDYQILFNHEMTNAQCRHFLYLSCRFVARRMLISAGYRLKKTSQTWAKQK